MSRHIEVCRRLLDRGGKDLLWMRDCKGRTCGILAAFRGHYDVLRLFGNAGGKEFLVIPNIDGLTAAATASYWGHSQVLQYLIDICGSDFCMVVFPQDGGTCAHMAARNGHAGVLLHPFVLLPFHFPLFLWSFVSFLFSTIYSSCSSTDFQMSGRSDLKRIHADCLRLLASTCGKELLSRARTNDGVTCAMVAAKDGHLEELRIIEQVGVFRV